MNSTRITVLIVLRRYIQLHCPLYLPVAFICATGNAVCTCYVFPSGLMCWWNKHELLYRVQAALHSKERPKWWRWSCWQGHRITHTHSSVLCTTDIPVTESTVPISLKATPPTIGLGPHVSHPPSLITYFPQSLPLGYTNNCFHRTAQQERSCFLNFIFPTP